MEYVTKDGYLIKTYDGGFKDNKEHGKGEMDWIGTKMHYKGDFVDGEIEGAGTLTWENLKTYKGYFKKGKM